MSNLEPLTAQNPADYAAEVEARITSGTLTLEQLAGIADEALTIHNALAHARLVAERQIAQQFLFDDDAYTKNAPLLRERGWTRHRITTARKYAQLSLIDIDTYIDAHTRSQKEASVTGARSLNPVTQRDERKSLAQPYTSPPIDIQIAREFGMDAADARAEMLTNSIERALQTMPNPRHAHVWRRYIGIQDDGTLGDKWTFDGIAKTMPDGAVVTREYVEALYYRASTHVFQTIAVDALNHIATRMNEAA